jgi:hypothetical protein
MDPDLRDRRGQTGRPAQINFIASALVFGILAWGYNKGSTIARIMRTSAMYAT